MIEISTKRFVIVIFILLLLWVSFLFFAIKYAKDLRTHPCNVCADKIGEEVVCYMGNEVAVFTGEDSEGTWDNKKSLTS